jgi:Pvc16 N-terminal domain
VSNHLAIAAVTETLRTVIGRAFEIDPDVPGATVTTHLPAQAAPGPSDGHRLNLFLYAVSFNQGWRNEPLATSVKPGETGYPPLALNLSYLLTPYEVGDDGHLGHVLLGKGMRALHDYPVLDPRDIRDAVPGNDLHLQVDRVRVAPTQLSVDDMSKLWTTFQAPYRLSAVYQVTVVLIEGRRAPKTPLPVLGRGKDDRGPTAQADLDSPYARLDAVELPARLQVAAQLGETITVRGARLDGPLTVLLRHPRLDGVRTLVPEPQGGADVFRLTLPPDTEAEAKLWPAGFYRLSALVGEADAQRETNALPLALAPRFAVESSNVERDGLGDATFVVTARPPLYPGQQAGFLVGDRLVVADPPEGDPEQPADTLRFVLRPATPGRYFTRLRVDGVDSVLVKPGVEPPAFDPAAQVTIT